MSHGPSQSHSDSPVSCARKPEIPECQMGREYRSWIMDNVISIWTWKSGTDSDTDSSIYIRLELISDILILILMTDDIMSDD